MKFMIKRQNMTDKNKKIIHYAVLIQKNNKLYFTLGGAYSKIYIDKI